MTAMETIYIALMYCITKDYDSIGMELFNVIFKMYNLKYAILFFLFNCIIQNQSIYLPKINSIYLVSFTSPLTYAFVQRISNLYCWIVS